MNCYRCRGSICWDGEERFCLACGARPDADVRLAGPEDQPPSFEPQTPTMIPIAELRLERQLALTTVVAASATGVASGLGPSSTTATASPIMQVERCNSIVPDRST